MVRAVYAPDSYGGFLSAPAACALGAKLLGRRGLHLEPHPMADGGEGTLEVLRFHEVAGAVEVVESARWLGFGCEAMASPWRHRSSAPLGRRLARPGDGPLVVGLGGTATMDGGAGALQALGLQLRDRSGRILPPGLAGGALHRVARVQGRAQPHGRIVELLVDVSTPLACAPELYGPQKGMQPSEIARQRDAFEGWGRALNRWRQEQGLQPLALDLPGGGAAGGLGFALAAVGARLVPGAERIARLTGLDAQLRGADAVVLGEGRLDRTSFEGKVAQVVTARSRGLGVPRVIALVGRALQLPPPPLGPDRVIETGEPSMEAFVAALERLGDALAAL